MEQEDIWQFFLAHLLSDVYWLRHYVVPWKARAGQEQALLEQGAVACTVPYPYTAHLPV